MGWQFVAENADHQNPVFFFWAQYHQTTLPSLPCTQVWQCASQENVSGNAGQSLPYLAYKNLSL